MKSCRARATLAASGLFFFYVLCAVAVRAACEIPLRLVGGNFVVVTVRLDGQGPFEFLLDTGADTTIVTPELAARLSLRPTSRVWLTTPAGSRAVPAAQVRAFAVGPKPAGGGEVLIDDLRELRSLDRRLDGILGQNVLGRLNYALDYKRKLLLIEEERDAPPSGTRLPVVKEEGKLIVRATSKPREELGLRLLLDSAAGGLVLFDVSARSRSLEIETPPGHLIKASTNAGSLLARRGRLRSLSVGGETFRDLHVALMPADEGDGPRPEDGLLPTSLFRSIYFNNAEGYVVLNPRLP